MMNANKVYVQLNVSVTLHQKAKYKAYCASKGVDMSKHFREYIDSLEGE